MAHASITLHHPSLTFMIASNASASVIIHQRHCQNNVYIIDMAEQSGSWLHITLLSNFNKQMIYFMNGHFEATAV